MFKTERTGQFCHRQPPDRGVFPVEFRMAQGLLIPMARVEAIVKQFGFWLSLALSVATVPAWGLGFRNPDQGARATGQGEAFVAQADDASAIYYNPAGLTQVKGVQVTSGAYFSFPNIHFHPVGGGELKSYDDVFMLPHFYAASDFGQSRWRLGLGFNIPYGNSITWGGDNPLSMAVDKSTMAIYAISPTVAYQINEQLSFGVGANVYYGDLMSRFRYIPGVDFELRGDGLTAGATVGLLWKPHWQHAIGIVYRSPFTVTFEGDATVRPAVLPDSGPSSASFTMPFPQSVAVGYAFRPNKKLKLEVDIEWTNWDTLNVCTVSSPNPFVAMDPRATVAFNWQDSFFYEFGMQYDLSEKWGLLFGYIFSENTVPESTFSPNLPDSDRHIFSVGAIYNTARLTFQVIYQYSRSTDRTVVGSPYGLTDGRWSSDGHAVMFTSTMKF